MEKGQGKAPSTQSLYPELSHLAPEWMLFPNPGDIP